MVDTSGTIIRVHALVFGASSEAIHAIQVAKDLGFYVTAMDGDPNAEGLSHRNFVTVMALLSHCTHFEHLSA
ncbi:MAG: hypothetical protein FWG08_00110 [Propionibacteriaceae bacterium]|nr:hypothetical protein [Propionibacteriaceae bacterium]